VRSFLYGLGLLLYVLFTSAFVQPVDYSESSSISETSETSKGKKKKKKKRRLRR
jgi:hypothetical protein|tara:strand:- start:115 stop:276 length:162 start_codon:yes stop_codon:yes gene_type:complete